MVSQLTTIRKPDSLEIQVHRLTETNRKLLDDARYWEGRALALENRFLDTLQELEQLKLRLEPKPLYRSAAKAAEEQQPQQDERDW